ncbi:MAG: LysR family transcriptional regulator [Nannocystaceae bacterium]|nr:LysR family transcriptional regulator [Nannocystaceae bacterium]
MLLEHLGDLEVFVQIVDRGTLAEAARTLDVTKNSVTRRLARLESQLGKRLLMRTTRTAALTEDGQRFYRHCQRILSEVGLAEDALVDRETLCGTLRIGIPGRLLLPTSLARIDAFLTEHPNLDLQVIASDQHFDLVEQRIDAAITVGPQPDSAHLRRRVTDFSKSVLAAAPSYIERCGRPHSLRDLKHHVCLRFQTESPQRQWPLVDNNGEEHEVPVGGSFASNDSRVLDTAMCAGLGIGLVAHALLRERKAAGVLVPILPRYRFAAMAVSLVYQRQGARGKRLDVLLDMMAAIVKDNLG